MSTELVSRPEDRHSVRRRVAVLALCAVSAGCRVRTTPEIAAVCRGGNVAQRLELSVDSVGARTGPALRALLGRRYRVDVTLVGGSSFASCADRTGDASVRSDLPDALAVRTAGPRRPTPRWRVQGVDVIVELNPGIADNSLTITLPLDEGAGRWDLSTIAGPVASGRATRME